MKTSTKKTASKKTAAAPTISCTALARTYNRVPERMRVVTVSYVAPADADLLTLIELAHEAGASRGDRTLSGVFEIQTDEGIWKRPDDAKLLMRTGVGLTTEVQFKSWDELEAEELA